MQANVRGEFLVSTYTVMSKDFLALLQAKIARKNLNEKNEISHLGPPVKRQNEDQEVLS